MFLYIPPPKKKNQINCLCRIVCDSVCLCQQMRAQCCLLAQTATELAPIKTDSPSIHSNAYSLCVCCVRIQNEHQKNYCKNEMKRNQGAHSPDMRVLSMGVYPIQRVNSQVVGQDDVSKRLNGVHPPHFTTTKQTNNNSHLAPIARIEFFVCVLDDSITTLPPRTRTYSVWTENLHQKYTHKHAKHATAFSCHPPNHHYHQSYTRTNKRQIIHRTLANKLVVC